MTRIAHPPLRFRARSAPTAPRRSDVERRRLRPAPHPQGSTAADGSPAELSLEIRRDGPRPVVVVSGDLDLVGQELFEALLTHVRSSRPGTVAVDLIGVSFVDSHGLSPALAPDVVVVAASPSVCRLLRLMGLPVPASP